MPASCVRQEQEMAGAGKARLPTVRGRKRKFWAQLSTAAVTDFETILHARLVRAVGARLAFFVRPRHGSPEHSAKGARQGDGEREGAR